MSRSRWRPGRDPRAVWHAPAPGRSEDAGRHHVAVVGGGIAGLTAATALAERGVRVTLLEREQQLGGRVASWDVETPHAGQVTMSRGFHAFFRQYYNLRALLRRTDPGLDRLTAVADYPLSLKSGPTDSFAGLALTPPFSIGHFVLRSPTFRIRDLARVDVAAAMELLDVDFPATFARYDGVSAAAFLDRLRFPEQARHLALEVFARSFFADSRDFSAGELVAMFHTYFLGSAEGLLFDVPVDDYDVTLWRPLGRRLAALGAEVRVGASVESVETQSDDGVRVRLADGEVTADAVVLATDRAPLQRLVAASPDLGDAAWRESVAAQQVAPPFVVWRLWLDRQVDPAAVGFRATSGFGPLDNVSVIERLEHGTRAWSNRHEGSVVELHAYAVSPDADPRVLREQLWGELLALHPELTGAGVRHEEWLWREDCPLVGTEPWASRPGVLTPDPRVVLAGDGVRCELPVALMERAATTGWQAGDALLASWGLAGHGVWSVPVRARHRGVPALARAARRLT